MNKIKTSRGLIKSVYLITSLFFVGDGIMSSSARNHKLMSSLNFSKKKSISQVSSNLNNQNEGPWILGYSDDKIKVYYQKINCEGNDSYRLRASNLTGSSITISYKLWSSAQYKNIELTPYSNLEGICASGYDYKMIEVIPAGLKEGKIKLTINYLK